MIYVNNYIWKIIFNHFIEIPTQDDIDNLYIRKMTRHQIKTETKLIINSILLVCKQLNSIATSYISELKEIYDLIEKYPKYRYESAFNNSPARASILLDAFYTGCDLPFADHSFDFWCEEIENDVKRTIQLIPESLNNTDGLLRCRHNITPFAAACYNKNIPIHIIEYMLQTNPDLINTKIYLNNQIHYVFQDRVETDRLPLFKKYIKYAEPSLQKIIAS